MNMDPKKDASFQSILAKLLKDVIQVEEPKTPEEKMVKELVDLRFDFVFMSWTSKSPYPERQEVKDALSNLNLVRNTREAQKFLKENPYFFVEIDRAIYRDMKKVAAERIAGLI